MLARRMPLGRSLMNIVLLVLLFFFVVFFFWCIWKSAADWRWYHLVLVSLIFLLAIPLLPLTAVVLKSRAEWNRIKEDHEARLSRAEREYKGWVYGVPGDPQRDPGLLVLQGKMRGFKTEVGRVYRDLEIRDRNANGFLLVRAAPAVPLSPDGLPIEGEGAAAAPVADQGGLAPVGSIVHAFAEQPLVEGGPALPRFYLGEYRVQGGDAQSVTLLPTFPLAAGQQQMANTQMRWALYEKMPIDGHLAFIATGSAPDDDHIFGRVDDQIIGGLLGTNVLPQTLKSYLRDGSRAEDNDPPESRWDKIEFTKKHSIKVDADEMRAASDGGFFNTNGQAVDNRLQRGAERGSEVTFEVGQQLIVKAEAAERLIADGVAKRIDRYFVRPMNSYEGLLPGLRRQIEYLVKQTAELERQKLVLQAAVDLTTQMQTEGQQRRLELEKDEAQLSKELIAIKDFVTKLETDLQQTRDEMSRLYQDNARRERELAAFHRAVLDAAEKSASDAVGG